MISAMALLKSTGSTPHAQIFYFLARVLNCFLIVSVSNGLPGKWGLIPFGNVRGPAGGSREMPDLFFVCV
jgi:hypothetical protein